MWLKVNKRHWVRVDAFIMATLEYLLRSHSWRLEKHTSTKFLMIRVQIPMVNKVFVSIYTSQERSGALTYKIPQHVRLLQSYHHYYLHWRYYTQKKSSPTKNSSFYQCWHWQMSVKEKYKTKNKKGETFTTQKPCCVIAFHLPNSQDAIVLVWNYSHYCKTGILQKLKQRLARCTQFVCHEKF